MENALNKVDWSSWTETINEALVVTPTVESDKFLDDLEKALNSENWDDWDDPKMTIGVDVDKDSADKAKDELSKYLGGSGSAESMTISPTFDYSDYTEKMKAAFSENVPTPEIDLEGLSSLLEKMDGMKGALEKRLAVEAVEAQVRLMEAAGSKTEAAARAMQVAAELQWRAAQVLTSTGEVDKTINIDAAGVEPEIEAFLWKILKRIQISANEGGSEFLLAAAD